MKKIILTALLGLAFLIQGAVFADEGVKLEDGTYEVPVFIKHFYEDKASMGDSALRKMAKVEVKGDEATFTLYTSKLVFMNLEGSMTNIFLFDTDDYNAVKDMKKSGAKINKIELNKSTVDLGEMNTIGKKGAEKQVPFTDAFTFTRKTPVKKEYYIAVWVDAMDALSSKKGEEVVPGKGEQLAVLKLDWDKAKKVGDTSEAKVDDKTNEGEVKGDPSIIDIMVNGKMISTDTPPYIQNGRTMVPLRFISEALGIDVDWDGETRTVTVGEGDMQMKLVIDSDKITKADGSTVTIESPAVIKDSRTMVPVRAIAELSGADVDWNPETRTVIIKK